MQPPNKFSITRYLMFTQLYNGAVSLHKVYTDAFVTIATNTAVLLKRYVPINPRATTISGDKNNPVIDCLVINNN